MREQYALPPPDEGAAGEVERGATLYLSLDGGLPGEFEALTGLEPQTRERRRERAIAQMTRVDGTPRIPCGGTFRMQLRPTRAAVLGAEEDGNPLFTMAPYGQGQVFFLNTPLEMLLTTTPGSFHRPEAFPCWQLYRHFAAGVLRERIARKSHPLVALTEHPLEADQRVLVALNLSPAPIAETLAVQPGWSLHAVLRGEVQENQANLTCRLPAHDAAVVVLAKTHAFDPPPEGGGKQ